MTYLDIDLHIHNPFLVASVEDRKRYAFITGLSFSHERSLMIPEVIRSIKENSAILDQGFDMGLYTYSANAYKQKAMIKEEYEFLVKLHKEFMRGAPPIDITIVLDPSIKTTFERISKRGRPHEKKYSHDYILGLRTSFHQYITMLQKSKTRKSIIICSQNHIHTVGASQKLLVNLIRRCL